MRRAAISGCTLFRLQRASCHLPLPPASILPMLLPQPALLKLNMVGRSSWLLNIRAKMTLVKGEEPKKKEREKKEKQGGSEKGKGKSKMAARDDSRFSAR